MANKIILDLLGTPVEEDNIALSSGHGYYAYASCEQCFTKDLLRNMSIWNGSTGSYETRSRETFNKYELDCRDRKFLYSSTFRKFCEHDNIELIIATDDNPYPLREFFESIK